MKLIIMLIMFLICGCTPKEAKILEDVVSGEITTAETIIQDVKGTETPRATVKVKKF